MKNINSDASFINDDFLLNTKTAVRLYHEYAAKMPIIDYHNHLSAKKIASKKGFNDITEAWLSEDHYKWRAMRANGIEEHYITGQASGIEKFRKWAETVPYTIKNPLFHWTHLELKNYFNVGEILQPKTSDAIYHLTSNVLNDTSASQLLEKMNVEVVCTTDDPIDDLRWHKQIKEDKGINVRVLPTFRSDTIADIQNENFIIYLEKLGSSGNQKITCLDELLNVLRTRVDYFHTAGCRLSDYGLTGKFPFVDFTNKEVDRLIKKRLNEELLSKEESDKYQSCIMYHLAIMYHEKGWVQQYHLGPIRNNNKRLIQQFGADAGCDSIGDYSYAGSISDFFGKLDLDEKLAKTITYNLNSSHNEVFATMMGNFNTSDIPGKMQWGAAWWFHDQKSGIEKQIEALSNLGLLSRFVGMLTDSRSFLSFPRHEYFRRILCNSIASDIENGELPDDIDFFGKIIQDICYYNAKNYFKFDQ